MTNRSDARSHERRRLGDWLPNKEATIATFRKDLAAQAHEKSSKKLSAGVVQELAALVNDEPVLRMDFTRAIDDALAAGYELAYSSVDELMVLLDYLMTYAPRFSETSLIICPMNGLLDWPMCMPSGYALFRDPTFNAQLKRVLNYWCGFLSGPYSRTHLNTTAPDGWFCPEAVKKMDMPQFLCEPQQPYWGFHSWNDFFTRQFRPDARPVADPENSKIVISACEASPYNILHDVKLNDRFWIKSQPYSLQDIFTANQHDLAQRFVGGSVYQAFLSAYNYHRWHAPVSGVISKAYLIDGTYYSAVESEGIDQGGLNDSQGYITAVATRAVIVINCEDPTLGQVGCVFVGMCEVSSCMIEALPGQRVKKGDEIGYFQYGGSTYCLIFEPGVIENFVSQAPFDDQAPAVKINTHIATAK